MNQITPTYLTLLIMQGQMPALPLALLHVLALVVVVVPVLAIGPGPPYILVFYFCLTFLKATILRLPHVVCSIVKQASNLVQ